MVAFFFQAALIAMTTNAPAALTVCTGARCWRNGASRLIAELEDIPQNAALFRRVGCSGVCPRNAVSVCEGPECPGPALALPAEDIVRARRSAEEACQALSRARPPVMAASADEGGSSGDVDLSQVDLSDVDEVKHALLVAELAGDVASIERLVMALEPLCDVDRIGCTPLLDGFWQHVWASSPPRWAQSGAMRHAIESAAPPDFVPTSTATSGGLMQDDRCDGEGGVEGVASPADSPGLPGLRAGPRGALWDDVSQGRGAYVQRARLGPLRSRELRATYTWLGGDAWDLEFVSRAVLLFGIIPIFRRRIKDPKDQADLDHALAPTFVDGEYLVLRSPAVVVAGVNVELRAPRVYLLRRQRNRLWQDNSFQGATDKWENRWEP